MAINIEDFDLSVSPADDFASYVNGIWKKNNPIPNKYTKWGTFEILHENNLKKLKQDAIALDNYILEEYGKKFD
jgi:putative endopeptidase